MEPKGSVAKAIVETETALGHVVEAGAVEALAVYVNALNLSASSEAIAGAIDLKDPKSSVTAGSIVDRDAKSDRPLRHPEVEELNDDVTYLDCADYSQSSPATPIYPHAR